MPSTILQTADLGKRRILYPCRLSLASNEKCLRLNVEEPGVPWAE